MSVKVGSPHHDRCSARTCESRDGRRLPWRAFSQRFRDRDGKERPITVADVLVVTPYNAQVNLLKRNDQRRNRPFSGDRIIRVVVGCALLRANVGRSCR